MAIPVATSELVGTFLEALGYGAYLVIFPQCLRVIIHKKLATRLKVYFLTSMALIAFFATLHIVVDLTRAFQAFTDNMNTADAPEAYYKNVNTRLNLMKNSAYTSATIVADTLLVYRTFVVWGRNYWIVIVPTLILFVDFAMSVWFTWSVNEARPGSSVLVSTVFARSKYFLIATLVLNVLCTFLISTRIWWIQSRVSGVKSTRSGANAISIIVESAAIYSAVTIVLIILSVLDMSEFFFFLNSMPPLIGIVFAYIILRSSSDKRNYQDTTVAASTGVLSPSSFRRTGDKRSAQSQEFSKPDGVHISLQHIVHRDDIDLEQQSDTDGSPYKHGNGLH